MSDDDWPDLTQVCPSSPHDPNRFFTDNSSSSSSAAIFGTGSCSSASFAEAFESKSLTTINAPISSKHKQHKTGSEKRKKPPSNARTRAFKPSANPPQAPVCSSSSTETLPSSAIVSQPVLVEEAPTKFQPILESLLMHIKQLSRSSFFLLSFYYAHLSFGRYVAIFLWDYNVFHRFSRFVPVTRGTEMSQIWERLSDKHCTWTETTLRKDLVCCAWTTDGAAKLLRFQDIGSDDLKHNLVMFTHWENKRISMI